LDASGSAKKGETGERTTSSFPQGKKKQGGQACAFLIRNRGQTDPDQTREDQKQRGKGRVTRNKKKEKGTELLRFRGIDMEGGNESKTVGKKKAPKQGVKRPPGPAVGRKKENKATTFKRRHGKKNFRERPSASKKL